MNSPPASPLAPASWPHSPAHRLTDAGAYMVTAGTHHKLLLFQSVERLTFLTNSLLTLAQHHGFTLQAWAVFPNHYHFIAASRQGQNLRKFIQHLHTATAAEINRRDDCPGRKVWFQFWDSHITFPSSFYARLNYVHQNAVHHGLVKIGSLYPWCSAGWFERKANRTFFETVSRFRHDTLAIPDDYEVPSA